MSRCLVSDHDYKQHRAAFSHRRLMASGLRGQIQDHPNVIGEVSYRYEDPPTVCTYCGVEAVEEGSLYCSTFCSINAGSE